MLQPDTSILWHLKDVAQKLHRGSSRLYTAFIDFKQASDSIPRSKMWDHPCKNQMPTHMLSIIEHLYTNADEYTLLNGDKSATVQASFDVKHGGCPLFPLLFSIYLNDTGSVNDGVQDALTGFLCEIKCYLLMTFPSIPMNKSFSIVCWIPIVSLCGGWSRLISVYSIVQVYAGLLDCWALFRDCVGASQMYKLFKLGVLLPCKSLLQTWSIRWEVFEETLSWWTPIRTTTNWPLIILSLPSLFLVMNVCRLLWEASEDSREL